MLEKGKVIYSLFKLLLRSQLVGVAALLLSAVGGTSRKTSVASIRLIMN